MYPILPKKTQFASGLLHPAITISRPLQAIVEENENKRRFCNNYNLLIDEDEVSLEEKENPSNHDDNINTSSGRHHHILTKNHLQVHPNTKHQDTKVMHSHNDGISQDGADSSDVLSKRDICNDTDSFAKEAKNIAFLDARSTPSVTLPSPSSSVDNRGSTSAHKQDHMKAAAHVTNDDSSHALQDYATKIAEQWHKHYNELVEFQKQNGHCNVTQKQNKHKNKHKQLASWVCRQRSDYKKLLAGNLSHRSFFSPECKTLLDNIGFEWSPLNDQWYRRYDELIQYKQVHGNCKVPKAHTNAQLSKWVINQRSQFRLMNEGKPSYMTPKRLNLLIQIGFEWSIDRMAHKKWQDRFEELCNFRELNGHCNVPFKYKENKKLGKWVDNQRYQYKMLAEGRKSYLTAERIECLEKIGFIWRAE